MTTPVSTTLNRRFSGPGANATSWEDTVRVLETAELFWLTHGPAGRQAAPDTGRRRVG